jgi:hypothetical protein
MLFFEKKNTCRHSGISNLFPLVPQSGTKPAQLCCFPKNYYVIKAQLLILVIFLILSIDVLLCRMVERRMQKLFSL